ncbi:transglutaminase family protein [Flavisphingomonas formosensis]|uniref:transglutaminase family protein n=1 Tax=Flavisphingomonas formosensis TaxID=861534 RepID=UPI0012FBC1E4|nr:transglutaminase family protein [Sphingomonas formosensis]
MIYAIRHTTRFLYEAPVRFARCNLRLRPIDWDGQKRERYHLDITPHATISTPLPSGYPANTVRVVVDAPASELVIESRSRIVVNRPMPQILPDDPSVGEIARLARQVRDLSMTAPANYMFASPMIPIEPSIVTWCAETVNRDDGIVAACFALAKRIKAEFRYKSGVTDTDTAPIDAFDRRTGVCQDFAQIMISGLRGLGLPAAYVSGYLRTLPPPGKQRLVGADATHAWVLVWCGPARGWIGFDPTNGIMMAGDHIVAAVGRDYADVSPIDGIFLGRNGQRVDVSVDVEPIEEETPRPTRKRR